MKRKFGILALFSVLTLIITSCGGSGTTTPPPDPDFSISVSNASPSIEEGSTVDITVTIAPEDGFSDQVALTITDLAEVTATFDPTSATTNSTLTLGSSTAGAYAMTITATSGDIEKTAAIALTVTEATTDPDPDPSTVTISGIVLDEEGRRFANVPVVVLGQSATSKRLATQAIPTITNSNGEFTLPGVTKPYDIAVVEQDDEDVVIYMGLTTENPVLYLIDKDSSVNRKRATLEGDTDSLPAPQANHDFDVIFGSPDTFSPQEINDTTNDNGNFSDNDVDWPGPTNTTSGTVHVLQGTTDGSEFTGYGSGAATLTDNVTTTIPDISLTDIGESNAGGNVTLPTDYTFDEINMSIIFDQNTNFQFAEDFSPAISGNFSFVAPQVPGGQLGVSVFAEGPDDRNSAIYRAGQTLNDINMSFTVPEAPSLGLPADDATNVTNATQFNWSASGFANSVYVVEFDGQTGSISNRNIYIVTKDLNTTIPDMSAQGFALSAGNPGDVNEYDWEVTAVGPLASVDEAATANFVKLFEGTVVNSNMARSDSQTNDFRVTTP